MKKIQKLLSNYQGATREGETTRLQQANGGVVSVEVRRQAKERPEKSICRLLRTLRNDLRQRDAELREAKEKMARSERDLAWAHEAIEEQVRRRNEELLRENALLRQEISKQQQIEEQIVQQNEFINHVVESLPHPFYVLDAHDYTVKMANSAAMREELKPGTTCYTLTHRRDTPCEGCDHSCPLQMVKQTKQSVIVEHIHFDRGGNPRHMEVHGYPVFDRQGNVAQMIEYALDITDRKQLEEELRSTAEKTRHFAYAVSHDLKSPMTGVLGLIRLLHRRYSGSFDEKGQKICGQILKGIEQMSELVEEINAYIKAKETPIHFELVDPFEVLHAVRDEFDTLLTLRGISWLEPVSLPSLVMDRMSMVRVFRNLVDNAMKYGGEKLGEIAIRYREEGDFHVISVSDDGVGIKPEDAERIFEVFSRGCQASGIEGTGLGLAIIREIVAKHGGRVWIEDSKRGATFSVSLARGIQAI